MNDPRIYPIALTMINGVGNILGRNLLQYFGSAESIFKEKSRLLEKVPGIGKQTAREIRKKEVLLKAEKELDFIDKNKINVSVITEETYPYRLKECPDAPLVFYSKGKLELNRNKILSIVGTRQASSYGLKTTEKFIQELASEFPELIIISGLAYGIDIYAHRSALKQRVSTIAVLAHGLDRIYPYSHRDIAVQMLEEGGLLTDYPSNTNPDRQNFIMRNRIVAGLSDATIVMESAEKGGSLITADLAFSYGREVFAFPGRINDKQSMGCNKLIKENKAALITNGDDFIQAIGWEKIKTDKSNPIQSPLPFKESSDELSEIEILLKETPLHINQIAIQMERPVQEIGALLFELEIEGKVKTLPGQLYKLSD